MELDLQQIVRLVRRWWWFLLLAPLVAGAAAWWFDARQHRDDRPAYTATATLLINPVDGSNDLAYSRTTYAELVVVGPVLDPVVASLGLPYGADQLRGMVAVEADPDLELLRVSVTDSDPLRAARIANEIAVGFQGYMADRASDRVGSAREQIGRLIVDAQGRIAEATGRILELERPEYANDPNAQNELSTLRARRSLDEASLRDLLRAQQTMEIEAASAAGQVEVSDPAVAPARADEPGRRPVAIVGVLAGFLLAAGLVLLLEHLDNSVKVGSDFGALTGSPMLSPIPRLSRLRRGREGLYVVDQPASPAAEAMRLLRTNLEFAAATRPITSLVVSSPGWDEGKSSVAANLAVVMAQAGLVTVVIDADMRRPSQARLFGVEGEAGLSSLLVQPDLGWRDVATAHLAPNLLVIPSGPLPPNPADLLSLPRLPALLAEIAQTADIILIDTPPILAVSDPLPVAAEADGVILVCEDGKTRRDALRRAAAALHRGSVRLVGVVLNGQANRPGEGAYYEPGPYLSAPGRARTEVRPAPGAPAAASVPTTD